ncbi:hypothetical protein PRUPE_1G385000 [Prunus persica]|uniref:Uncharacterized protein n=1 Tax=Prunus persica TaxID=3760 RepID=A0A251RAL7_PRUPE|nr:hypothetical protein PRUPE_1G385000 [Prunus persica]
MRMCIGILVNTDCESSPKNHVADFIFFHPKGIGIRQDVRVLTTTNIESNKIKKEKVALISSHYNQERKTASTAHHYPLQLTHPPSIISITGSILAVHADPLSS